MTPRTDPSLAMEAMLGEPVDGFDSERAIEALSDVRLVRGYVDRYEAMITSRLNELHTQGDGAPAVDLHTRHGGMSSKEAGRRERRSKALDQAPSMASALTTGAIGAEHADALANATIGLTDDLKASFFDLDADLANDAARMTPEQFSKNCRDVIGHLERDAGVERAERQRRGTRLDKKIDNDGMYLLNARLHPELGTAVFNAIDAETASLVKQGGDRSVDRSHLAAEALGNLVIGGHQAVRPTEAEIRIHVDEQTASTGQLHHHSICEYDDGTLVPPASVVRLLCNGVIVPIVTDPNGVAVNVGRQQRVANRKQRQALRGMYRNCAFHGCDVPFSRCEMHHIHEWEHGGPTDLDNLLPVCSRHHHLIHEGGWSLHLAPDRTLTVRQPDGTEFFSSPLQMPVDTALRDRRRERPPDRQPGPEPLVA